MAGNGTVGLYKIARKKVNLPPVVGVPLLVWESVQAVGLSNGLKDLHFARLHRCLPVRDKMHRDGLGLSPLCLGPSCGAGEREYHVIGLWLARRELVRNGKEWSTERLAKGVEWESNQQARSYDVTLVSDQELTEFLGGYAEVVSGARLCLLAEPWEFVRSQAAFFIERSGCEKRARAWVGAQQRPLLRPVNNTAPRHLRSVRGGEGHAAEPCLARKTCNGCGKPGHPYRVCPERKRSFAEVTTRVGGVGAAGNRGRDLRMDVTEVDAGKQTESRKKGVCQARAANVEKPSSEVAAASPLDQQMAGEGTVEGEETGGLSCSVNCAPASSDDDNVAVLTGKVRWGCRVVEYEKKAAEDGDLAGGQKSVKRVKGLGAAGDVGG
ncbi:hypothetical protein Q8A73_006339 [Channa argus]|nr:hypothetical protein Q8A73_006339 [Channa argus]